MRPVDHFFDASSHLSEEGIALYADAIRLGRLAELPDVLREHVEACTVCKVEVIELVSHLEDEPADTAPKHPFFDAKPVSPKIPIMTLYRIAVVLAAVFFLVLLYILIWGVPAEPRPSPAPPHRIPDFRQAPDSTVIPRDSSLSYSETLPPWERLVDAGPGLHAGNVAAPRRGEPVSVSSATPVRGRT